MGVERGRERVRGGEREGGRDSMLKIKKVFSCSSRQELMSFDFFARIFSYFLDL